MIQRQQTLWLLLAATAAVCGFVFPFAIGDTMINGTSEMKRATVDAGSSFLLILTNAAALIISAFTIFLYKNRQRQLLLCAGGILISVVLLILYIREMNALTKPVLALSAVLPVISIGAFIMAWRGIRKDDKLVKSLDKLR